SSTASSTRSWRREPTVWRPVDEVDRPDQARARNRAPDAGVARVQPVVAHEEVLTLRHARPGVRLVVAQLRIDVRLLEELAVDVDVAVPLRDDVAGQPDQPLDERAADAARVLRRFEDHDLAAVRAAEAVGEPVRDHAVVERSLAVGAGLGAVERRLHRRGRDAVRLRDLRLEDEDEPDGEREREHPFEQLPHPGMVLRAAPVRGQAPRVVRGARRAAATTRSTAWRSGPGTSPSPFWKRRNAAAGLPRRARSPVTPSKSGTRAIVRLRPAIRSIVSLAMRSASAGSSPRGASRSCSTT